MLNLNKLFRRRKDPRTEQPKPLAPYRFGLTLDTYRANEAMVSDAREIMRSPVMQRMMSVLQHEIPLDSIDAVRGYRRALRILELMAEHPASSAPDIEATFGAEREFPDNTEPQTN